MRMRARLLWLGLAALLCLLLLLPSLLLFTPQGNQLLWQQLRARLPALQGELVSGHLGRGWELSDAGWQGEGMQFSSRHLRLEWAPARLLRGQLLIQQLSGEGIRITLPAAGEAPAPEPAKVSAPHRLFVMPLAIRLQQLRVRDFQLNSPAVKVRVDALDSAASWRGKTLHLSATQSAGVEVELLPAGETLPAAAAPLPAAAEGAVAVRASPAAPAAEVTPAGALASLPEVFIPFAIELDELTLAQGRYHQPGFDTGMLDLRLSGNFTGTRLEVRQLAAQHALGEASLSGQMIFEQYYALKAELTASTTDPWLQGQLKGRQARMQAEGDLSDLGFSLTLSGQEQLQLAGRLKPLSKALPFSLEGSWQQLNWPLTGQAVYRAQQGKLAAKGDLDGYRLQLDSGISVPDYPPFSLALKLAGDLDGVELQPLRLSDGQTEVSAKGELDWRNGLTWQGSLALSSKDLSRLRPELSGHLKGDTRSRFQWRDGGWQLALEKLQVKGQLNGYPLGLSGQLSGNHRQHWRVEQLLLDSGPNRLRVDGSLAERWDLRARLDAPTLSALYPPLSGQLQGTARIDGPLKQPAVELALSIPALQGQGLQLSHLSVKGNATLAPKVGGRLMLTARELQQGENRFRDLRLSLDGNEAAHRLRLEFAGTPLAGLFELQGRWRASGWSGRLLRGELDTEMGRWALEQPLSLASKSPFTQWQLGGQCWRSEADSVCVEPARLSAAQGELSVRLQQLTTARLKPWYPPHFSWQSRLQGQGKLGWRQGRPRMALTLETGPGNIIADDRSSEYRAFSLRLQLDERLGEVVLDFDSAALGQAKLDVRLEEPLGARRLGGTVMLENLRLAGIAPLVDELHRTTGRVDAKGRLAGTLSAPQFHGQVRLSEGEIDTSQDLASIRQLQAVLDIAGTRANLRGSLLMGKGKLDLRGVMDWQSGQPQGELSLSGAGLRLGLGGYGRATANPQLRMSFGEELRLTGTVVIPRARIEVKSLPEDVVDVSDDVIIVGPQQPALAKPTPLPFYLNLKLLLGSDVRLTALDLKTRLTGSLELSMSPGKSLRGQGRINLVDGRYKAYGQNLLIRSGRLLFSGNLAQPYLAVDAIRDPATMEDDDITVGVRVSGPASAPEAQLFSEPELPNTDKFSYLLRGKSSSATGSGSSNEAMTAMLLGAGLGQTGGLFASLSENLGLQDFTLDTTGSGADTQVSVSGNLLPGLQIQYGVGVFTSISEVRIRLELMPRLYLQALSGLNQAVDLFYKFEF